MKATRVRDISEPFYVDHSHVSAFKRKTKAGDFYFNARRFKNYKALAQSEEASTEATYFSSVMPFSPDGLHHKYCDLTGLYCNYIDPKSGIRYFSAFMTGFIKSLTNDQIQSILELRGANTIIK